MVRSKLCLQVLLAIAFVACDTGIFAQTSTVKVLGNDTLTFEEAGKTGSGGAVFASSVSGLKFEFYQSHASINVTPDGAPDAMPIRLSLAGASQSPRVSPKGLLPGVVSYFPSRDTSTWRTNLRTWSGLRYQGIYPGIDLVYYGNRGQLEYDFVVSPGHDPKNIALEISSARHVTIAEDGGLDISGGSASLRFSKPVIYQLTADGSRESIAGRYVKDSDGRIGFDIST